MNAAVMLPAESQVVIMDRCHVADDYRNSLVTSLIHRRGYRVVYVKIIKQVNCQSHYYDAHDYHWVLICVIKDAMVIWTIVDIVIDTMRHRY